MVKKIKEFVTYWGPSINDWGDGTERRFTIERDEDLLKQGVESGGRKMEKISLNDIFEEGVVTGVDMENGFMPLVLYAQRRPDHRGGELRPGARRVASQHGRR